MKIRVLSDLHVEFGGIELSDDVECDVVVPAGDIDVLRRSSVPKWARQTFPNREIVWVLGNHEHYGANLLKSLAHAHIAAKVHGVHLLEKRSIELGGVRFLGCTLWTDFALLGDIPRAIAAASEGMADFSVIKFSHGHDEVSLRLEDTVAMHKGCVSWLDRTMGEPFKGKTVVVTHHAPHPKCNHPAYEGSSLSPAYCSDLMWLIEKRTPDVWISGHTHASHRAVFSSTTNTFPRCTPARSLRYIRRSSLGTTIETILRRDDHSRGARELRFERIPDSVFTRLHVRQLPAALAGAGRPVPLHLKAVERWIRLQAGVDQALDALVALALRLPLEAPRVDLVRRQPSDRQWAAHASLCMLEVVQHPRVHRAQDPDRLAARGASERGVLGFGSLKVCRGCVDDLVPQSHHPEVLLLEQLARVVRTAVGHADDGVDREVLGDPRHRQWRGGSYRMLTVIVVG